MKPMPILRELGEDPEVNGRTVKVYALLPDLLSFGEYRPLKYAVLCRRLHVDKAAVSRSMRVLVRRGYVLKGDPVDRVTTYMLTQSRRVAEATTD